MKQYIDFYKSQRSAIFQNSSEAMNALREEALAVVEGSDLPRKGDENYEITDVDALFAPDYGINVRRLQIPIDMADSFRCDVPNMSTWLYAVFNDTFHSGKTSGVQLPAGVVVDSLCEASKRFPELVSKYYGKTARLSNPQVALNTLLVQDGVFVYVPDNVRLERPLQLINILNASVPMMVNRRMLIVAGRNSEVKILTCDHTQSKETDFLNNQVIEIVALENSIVDLYDMEESSLKTRRVSSLWADQKDGSNVLVNGITLLNGITRNEFNIEVNGMHCETRLLGMAICGENESIDNCSYIGHNTSHCHSNELFKYVLDDNALGAFSGKILVKQGADKVEAYQSNKNILASQEAKMHTKPQLEIYNDDVRCSHGSTIGQLDNSALFYMQSRGISLKEARTLLMQAFMSDVVDGVRMEALRDRLRHLVEKRFHGQLALCRECNGACRDITNQH